MAIDETLANIIAQYNNLLTSDPVGALNILLDYQQTFKSNALYLQFLGEAFLENNDVEKAYEVLNSGCQLDPQGQFGVEKFFHLGQIIGGKDGVNLIEIGIAELIRELELINQNNEEAENETNIQILVAAFENLESIVNYILMKLTKAIGSIIEIWMTDLCMEEEAEKECEKWSEMLIQLCDSNPETHSLIASVKISQQRFGEAETEIKKSWDLYKQKKLNLESTLEVDTSSQDEYLDLYEQLNTLSKYALECGMFTTSIEISTTAREINENSIESAYLEGFSNYLETLRLQNNINESDAWKVSREFEKYSINSSILNDEQKELILNSQLALSGAVKLLYNPDLANTCDEELKSTIEHLLNNVGGFVAREPKIDVNEESVLDQISD